MNLPNPTVKLTGALIQYFLKSDRYSSNTQQLIQGKPIYWRNCRHGVGKLKLEKRAHSIF